jgi:hypothetical protein
MHRSQSCWDPNVSDQNSMQLMSTKAMSKHAEMASLVFSHRSYMYCVDNNFIHVTEFDAVEVGYHKPGSVWICGVCILRVTSHVLERATTSGVTVLSAQRSTDSPAWPTMSLFLTIFVLTFVTQLISWVGQSVLLERVRFNPPVDESTSTNTHSHPHSQVYEWYLWLTRSDLATRHRELKKDLLTKKAELLRLSAKDHFAKYMKLKRSVDKGLSDLEKLSACCGLPCSVT